MAGAPPAIPISTNKRAYNGPSIDDSHLIKSTQEQRDIYDREQMEESNRVHRRAQLRAAQERYRLRQKKTQEQLEQRITKLNNSISDAIAAYILLHRILLADESISRNPSLSKAVHDTYKKIKARTKEEVPSLTLPDVPKA
ncbi:hypothetical protein F5884DRAFT_856736 [Xylogone sp. PMI_703]|nr:hypothetical protein F5884DRAFT_856736 [Xylogone sp. PMI_703]